MDSISFDLFLAFPSSFYPFPASFFFRIRATFLTGLSTRNRIKDASKVWAFSFLFNPFCSLPQKVKWTRADRGGTDPQSRASQNFVDAARLSYFDIFISFFFSFHDPFNPLKLISIHGHTMNTMASILLLSKIKIFRATSLRFRRCPRSLLPRVPFCHKHDVITTRDLRAVPTAFHRRYTSFSSSRTTHSLLKISIERMFPRHRVITSISILL